MLGQAGTRALCRPRTEPLPVHAVLGNLSDPAAAVSCTDVACAGRKAPAPRPWDSAPPPPLGSESLASPHPTPPFPPPRPVSPPSPRASGDGRRREERVEPRQPGPCALGCNEPAGTHTAGRAEPAATRSGVRGGRTRSQPAADTALPRYGKRRRVAARGRGGARGGGDQGQRCWLLRAWGPAGSAEPRAFEAMRGTGSCAQMDGAITRC